MMTPKSADMSNHRCQPQNLIAEDDADLPRRIIGNQPVESGMAR